MDNKKYAKIKVNSRKHVVLYICKECEAYKFWVVKLIDNKDLINYIYHDNWCLHCNRDKISIVVKEFYLSEEIINAFHQLKNINKNHGK